MSDEVLALRESIVDLESQLQTAEGRTMILQAERDKLDTYRTLLEQDRDANVRSFRQMLNERDQLLARLRLADELADTVEHHHEMSRLAEADLSRRIDLAAASYRLGTAQRDQTVSDARRAHGHVALGQARQGLRDHDAESGARRR